jgi:2-polyprenyl-3-methyl-5-hydroxy-6-metoxy-1,4-benzoquinol methylase
MPKFNYTTHIIRLDNGSSVGFTAHNIRLDDGSYTKPDVQVSMEKYPWFIAAKNILETVFPGDKKRVRLADVGCLEGGFAVEFARVGFNVLGIEIRESNFAACNFVNQKLTCRTCNL